MKEDLPRRKVSIGCKASDGCSPNLHTQYGDHSGTSARCSGTASAPKQYAHGSTGILKTWFQKYRLPAGATRIATAEELQNTYGDEIKTLHRQYQSDYTLCKALEQRKPPLYVTKNVMTGWLKKYGGQASIKNVDNAGHLELYYGQRIRDDATAKALDAEALAKWLRNEASVSAAARTCQHWLSKDWSTSGKLLTPESIEKDQGERLRLHEYKEFFADDAASQNLADAMAEGQPAVLVNSLTLRQCYTKYHPDSGPVRIDSAGALEDALGAALRTTYAGLKKDVLSATLGKRRKPVLVSIDVCKGWLRQYAEAAAIKKRPASASSYEPPAAGILKRPAAVSSGGGPAKKRPAASTPAVSAASSSSAPAVLISIIGATALEQACGAKYRHEQTDLGFGHGVREMVQILRTKIAPSSANMPRS